MHECGLRGSNHEDRINNRNDCFTVKRLVESKIYRQATGENLPMFPRPIRPTEREGAEPEESNRLPDRNTRALARRGRIFNTVLWIYCGSSSCGHAHPLGLHHEMMGLLIDFFTCTLDELIVGNIYDVKAKWIKITTTLSIIIRPCCGLDHHEKSV